ncbi:MAG TPA: hypothetical protein VGD74_03170, partial [Vulgatibacter sp.]
GSAGESGGGAGGSGGGPGGDGGSAGSGGDGGSGGGTGGSGGTGGAGGAGPVGCGSVPEEGICYGSSIVRTCIASPARPDGWVVDRECSPWELCVADPAGAYCANRTTTCRPGASECLTQTSMQECGTNGTWTTSSCNACRQTPFGAMCEPAFATRTFDGILGFEYRQANASLTDWTSPVSEAAAAGLLVTSYRSGTLVDSSIVQEDGSFSVLIPSPPTSNDTIEFYTVAFTNQGADIALGVADPGLEPGLVPTNWISASDASYWRWTLGATQPSGRTWIIGESNWSAAVLQFQYARSIRNLAVAQQGRRGGPFIVWSAPDVDFDCGACFWSVPFVLLGQEYDSQVFISGGTDDMAYWSAAVFLHEMGHWNMHAYGTSPAEGGRHCLGVPALPGLAWSEGWATFYSSDARNDPTYFDKSDGTFWWIDIDSRRHWGVTPFDPPTSNGGMLQRIDEAWVAGALWDLSRDPTIPANLNHVALGSPRMNGPPYARGYTTKSWDVDSQCRPVNVIDTGVPAPMLADFLDALRCEGAPAAAVTGAVTPYPYPVNAPICAAP